MRHSRLFTALFLSLATLIFTGTALADSVNLSLIGPGGNNGGGVYTYPYNFYIGNSTTPTPLICDTFDNEVIPGEHWTANVYGLLSGQGLFGNKLLDYKAAGLIFEGILAGNINPTAGNWAIWGLFSSNAATNPYFLSSGAAGIDGQYLLSAVFAPDSAFNGLVLYTPIAGTQSWGGTPQEYIGRVAAPEPSELSMFITTLFVALGAVVYAKKLGLKPVISMKG
jgi:hypothetical protein